MEREWEQDGGDDVKTVKIVVAAKVSDDLTRCSCRCPCLLVDLRRCAAYGWDLVIVRDKREAMFERCMPCVERWGVV